MEHGIKQEAFRMDEQAAILDEVSRLNSELTRLKMQGESELADLQEQLNLEVEKKKEDIKEKLKAAEELRSKADQVLNKANIQADASYPPYTEESVGDRFQADLDGKVAFSDFIDFFFETTNAKGEKLLLPKSGNASAVFLGLGCLGFLTSIGIAVAIGSAGFFLIFFIVTVLMAYAYSLQINGGHVERRNRAYSRLMAVVHHDQVLGVKLLRVAELNARARLEQARSDHQSRMANLMEAIGNAYKSLSSRALAVSQVVAADHPEWEGFPIPQGLTQKDYVRLGSSKLHLQGDAFAMNVGVPLRSNLLIRTGGSSKGQATSGVQAYVARALASILPGQLKLLFIDPVGIGQNVAQFMRLADSDENLVSSRAWSEPQHIEQRLADLTEHMENVIQKYLRGEYKTIEEYNAHAGEVAEPYRLLVVFDFPVNFSEAAARRLVSIAQNGPRCGVYTVVLVDTEKPLPYGFDLADLEQGAVVIERKGERFVWRGFDQENISFSFDEPPPPEILNRLLDYIGKTAKASSRVEVPFRKIALPKESWWQGDSSEGLVAALGPAGARKVQYLELGKGTAHHGLIAGRTGSGKSTLLHTLITTLATAYSPDELELYLIDFKEGVEFKRYANAALPHARVVAVQSEREFGLSVLQGLDKLIAQRGELFKRFDAKNLREARERSGERIPRVLLLVDEFQVFFAEDDRIASESLSLIDRIVRQGRGFGVHALFGSQSLAGSASLPRPIMDQMAVRIALQCSEADSRIILAEDNPAARLLSRPGEAIYNAVNGMIEGNNRFQVALLDEQDQQDILEQVRALAQSRGFTREPLVFEGNAPASFEHKNPLAARLVGPWPGPSRKTPAYLGEPIAIKEPTAASFRRQSGCNLLLVGQDEAATTGMLATALLSLAVQQSPRDARFYVLDFTAVDGEGQSSVFEALREELPHGLKLGRRREIPVYLGELMEELGQRLEAEQGGAGRPSAYLVIAGLQRARDLRQEDAGFSFDAPAVETPGQQLAKLLRDGPELGLHALLSCDTLANLNRTLERRSLNELDMRVVLQMSADDSSALVDSPAANRLGPHRALFYSAEEGRVEKFRPYRAPDPGWLSRVLQVLRGKEAP